MKVIYRTAFVTVSLFLSLAVIRNLWMYKTTKDFDCLVELVYEKRPRVKMTKGQVLIHQMTELVRKSALAMVIVVFLTDFVIPVILRMT